MSGGAALEAVDRDTPDLIVLDLGLPDMDGVDVCVAVRQSSNVPILVLSARGAEGDKVRALDAGADDYVTKPFGAEELLARIRASLRRGDTPPPASEPIVRGGLVIDRQRFRVLRDGEEVRLTPKEFELLTYLAQAVEAAAAFVERLKPAIAYLAAPTRPPSEPWVQPASEEATNRAFQRFAERLPQVELLTGFEGTGFGTTGDAARDLLAITAVHPMRKDAVLALLTKSGADRAVLDRLVAEGMLRPVTYRDHVFYLRRFS